MALQERVEVLGRHGHRVRSSTRARATRPPDAFGTFPCPSFWRGPQSVTNAEREVGIPGARSRCGTEASSSARGARAPP